MTAHQVFVMSICSSVRVVDRRQASGSAVEDRRPDLVIVRLQSSGAVGEPRSPGTRWNGAVVAAGSFDQHLKRDVDPEGRGQDYEVAQSSNERYGRRCVSR